MNLEHGMNRECKILDTEQKHSKSNRNNLPLQYSNLSSNDMVTSGQYMNTHFCYIPHLGIYYVKIQKWSTKIFAPQQI